MRVIINSKEILIDREDALIFSKTPKYKGCALEIDNRSDMGLTCKNLKVCGNNPITLKIKVKYLITAIKYIFSM